MHRRHRRLAAWAALRRWLRALALPLAGLACSMAAAAPAAVALLPIRDGELHGLIDAQGRVVLPAEFDDIQPGEPLILARKGMRHAYFDAAGQMVVAPQEAWTQRFAEGLVAAPSRESQGGRPPRWGYADARQQWVIQPAWQQAEPFVDGLAIVGLEDAWGRMKYGAIDRSGKLVVPAVHDKLLATGGGLVRSESGHGGSPARTHRVFDARGQDLTPPGVDFVGLAADGMVRIWAGRRQGYMSTSGRLLVPPQYEQASDFREGRARVWLAGKFGFIDKSGQLLVPARWDAAEDFSDGLALVSEGGRQHFIDPRGQVVLTPPAEHRVGSFSHGRATLRAGRLYGFIDKSGSTVIEPQFSYARSFAHGLAFVSLPSTGGGGSAYVDAKGRIVWRSTPAR